MNEQRILRIAWRPFLVAVASLLYALSSAAQELPDFIPLVKQNSAAVVNISTIGKSNADSVPGISEDNPLYEFFRRFFEDMPEQLDGRKTISLGSGFILSADGYVITNNHVIEGADEIVVRLSDRRELVAEVVGGDERSDIAVLKVGADNLPHVQIGSSEDLRVGEWVLAIGSPFGFDHSVTAGIVSAKGRSLPGAGNNYVPFIQTDVAINPGNSGGPLFDMEGKVVGVNAQIYSRNGGFMGLSFTIPVDTVMYVVEQLRDKGRVSRGWLGVLIQDVDRELATSFGMHKPAGALISKILPNGPAKNAGFKVGDIIVEFNGHAIHHSAELPPVVGETPIGSSVAAIVMRDGERATVEVTLEELPPPEELETAAVGKGPAVSRNGKLGLEVEELSEEQRAQLDLSERGVRVTRVDKGPAEDAGIRVGDIILSIGQRDIENVVQFREVVSELETGRSVPVLLQRRDSPIFLALRVPEK